MNQLIRSLAPRWYMPESAVAELQRKPATLDADTGSSHGIGLGGLTPGVTVAWLAVGIPLLWGFWVTVSKALVLFH